MTDKHKNDMKKQILTLAAAIAMGSMTLSAQTINAVEDGKYDIKVGDILEAFIMEEIER